MNLYLISQTVNRHYDTYDSAIVCAPDEEAARRTYPDPDTEGEAWLENDDGWLWGAWTNDLDQIKVRLIGAAAEGVAAGVVLASFNAG